MWSTIDKCLVMRVSNKHFDVMDAEIRAMQDEIENLPSDSDFRWFVAECEYNYARLRIMCVQLKQQFRGEEAPEREQLREIWETLLQPRDDIEEAINNALHWWDEADRAALVLFEIENEFFGMTLEKKREAIAESDDRLRMIREAIDHMEAEFQRLPAWFRSEEDLEICNGEFARLCDSFASKREEIRDQEVPEQPEGDRSPPVEEGNQYEDDSAQDVPNQVEYNSVAEVPNQYEDDSAQDMRNQEEEQSVQGASTSPVECSNPGAGNRGPGASTSPVEDRYPSLGAFLLKFGDHTRCLETVTREFRYIQTLEEKRGCIEDADCVLSDLQGELSSMQGELYMIVTEDQDNRYFVSRFAQCQEHLNQLHSSFESLERELSRQEAAEKARKDKEAAKAAELDRLLIQAVRKQEHEDGPWRWDWIAEELRWRYTPNECREKYLTIRWRDLDHQIYWTDQDEKMLGILQRKEPDRWYEFGRWLPGKSADNIRGRWSYLVRKRAMKEAADAEAARREAARRKAAEEAEAAKRTAAEAAEKARKDKEAAEAAKKSWGKRFMLFVGGLVTRVVDFLGL
jgi:chemotaxis protein histidine kinase CheA